MNQEYKDKLHLYLDGYEYLKCVQFIEERLHNDEYRGIQLSQHNRYTQDIILTIIEEIYKIAGEARLQIRTTDLSKRPQNTKDEEEYAKLTTNISNRVGRCTQDSLRKNIFVDMHRMGLLERYDAKGRPVDPLSARGQKKYICLTDLAIQMMKEKDIFTLNMLYTNAIETLMNGYGADLLDIMVELGTDYIDINEMALFTSWLGRFVGNRCYTKTDIAELIKEYRTLSRFQRQGLLSQIQKFCDPNEFIGDKTGKRDWHNWINESQQIASLLGQTAYFEYNNERLKLRIERNSLFEDDKKLKRSLKAKQDYFINHHIEKLEGFELHHVVPLCWAKSKTEYSVLDTWENMVYIDAYSHAKITQNRNRNVKLQFVSNDALFCDALNHKVRCNYNTQIAYEAEKQSTMLTYNEQLLSATKKKDR